MQHSSCLAARHTPPHPRTFRAAFPNSGCSATGKYEKEQVSDVLGEHWNPEGRLQRALSGGLYQSWESHFSFLFAFDRRRSPSAGRGGRCRPSEQHRCGSNSPMGSSLPGAHNSTCSRSPGKVLAPLQTQWPLLLFCPSSDRSSRLSPPTE